MNTRLDQARAALAAAEAAARHGVAKRPADTSAPPPTGSAHDSRGPHTPTAGGVCDTAGAPPTTAHADRDDEPHSDQLPVDDEAFAAARAVATRTLAHHARTRKQLATKLAARDFEPEVVERTLDWCTQHGLIDDDSYAAQFVQDGHQVKGLGRAALRHKLLDRGIAPDTVEQHVAVVDAQSERAAAEHVVRRRLSALAGLGRTVAMRRLGAQLARRGFDAELAYSVIRQEIDQHPAFGRD